MPWTAPNGEAACYDSRRAGTRKLHQLLCGNLQPDLTVLLDNEVSATVDRARRRNRQQKHKRPDKDENRFEQESRAFFGRVRHAYLAIATREPNRVQVIDARGT